MSAPLHKLDADVVVDAPQTEYRILALNGGGARGLLQAAFLECLERDVGDLRKRFDLIAATSTGALVGLGIAKGVPASELAQLYRRHSATIFRPRTAAWLRKGARYAPDELRHLLGQHFGDSRLGDLDVDVLVCASALNRYQGKVFTREDRDVSLVDAALASAAAPTFFPPVVPEGSERGYIDGGLWANDPLPIAVAHASRRTAVGTEMMDALSLGTGRVPRGCTPAEVSDMRTLSVGTVRFLLEITSSLQEWASQHLLDRLTGTHVRRINPELIEWVALDDAERAVRTLPGLAEVEYEQQGPELVRWLESPRRTAPSSSPPLHPSLEAGIRAAGITRVIPARRYYAEFRQGRESISAYVSAATRTLTMISINLATGGELERIERVFAELLDRTHPVRIRVSLLDYEDPALMAAISSILDMRADRVQQRISDTMSRLVTFRDALDDERRSHVELFRHRTIPSASAILIDANARDGVIQLETKPYRAPPTASWALEVQAGSDFFETLRKAYHDLIDDGVEVLD
jgi:predicted acylesterase/phospholipase RssA